MLTDIDKIESQTARDIVIARGTQCFCVNQDGVQIQAIEYAGHYWNLHGDPLTSDWEPLPPPKNLLSLLLIATCFSVSLITLVVLYL